VNTHYDMTVVDCLSAIKGDSGFELEEHRILRLKAALL
jgi:hypothetical protein